MNTQGGFRKLALSSRDNVCVKVAALLLLFPCFIFPPRIFCQASPEAQIESAFHAGQRDMQDGNFTRAVDEFKRVLTLDPALVEAEVNLGLAYQSLFEYDQAVRHLAKASRERPNLLAPNVIVGMDYLKLGNAEKAIPFLQQALKIDPSNRDARNALASAYVNQANFRLAAEQFRQMAALDSDQSEALFKLGHEYLDLSARLAYRAAHLYRDSAWGHRFLGDLLFQRSRWDDAAKEFQKAMGSDPTQAGLHTALGQTYLHAKKLDEAEKEFRRELQMDTRNELAWLGLANAQLAANQAKAALESVRQVWSISADFLATQRDFVSVELSQESVKAALADLQDEPANAAKHFLMASLCDRECADREWKAFESDWQQQGASPAGTDACQLHQYSLCIDSLKSRKTLSDAERLLLGKAYFTLQQYEPAADALAQIQGVSKENAEASYWLTRTYQAQGAEAYARLQELFHDSWRACQLRAEGAALRGNLEDAVKEFRAALHVRENEPELHEALGELYLNNHSNDAAAQSELERALTLDPARTRALYLLGRLFVQNKDNDKAFPYLQRALRFQPDFVEANSLLGTVYVRTGRFAEAVPKLVKAAPSDHYGNVHYQLYIAYRKLGRTELAQKELALSQDLRRSYLEHDEATIMGSPQLEPDASGSEPPR